MHRACINFECFDALFMKEYKDQLGGKIICERMHIIRKMATRSMEFKGKLIADRATI